MVMKPEPIFLAWEAVAKIVPEHLPGPSCFPQGMVFNQSMAAELAKESHLILFAAIMKGWMKGSGSIWLQMRFPSGTIF